MKFNFRKYAGAMAAVLLLTIMVPAPLTAADRVRIGILPVVDTLPLLVGQDKGYFLSEDIDLELITFQSALERDAAMQAGKIDGYFGDILNTLLLVQAGQKVRIITTVYHTHPDHRMFGIITAPGSSATDIGDLENRAVVISRSTVIEYLLDTLLDQRKLRVDFVKKQEIKKMQIRLQMLMTGQVAAALLPEPLLTLAEIKGGRVLLDDRILDTCLTILAVELDLLIQEPRRYERFLRAYGKAVADINATPEAYQDTLVTRTRFPRPAQDAYRVPKFPPVGPPARKDVAAVRHWMENHEMGGHGLTYEQVVWTSEP